MIALSCEELGKFVHRNNTQHRNLWLGWGNAVKKKERKKYDSWRHGIYFENEQWAEDRMGGRVLKRSQRRCAVQFSSVAQSCPTLCNPMNRSTPGLPIHHQLPESTQIHVHWVGDASNHLILCHSLLLLPSILPSIKIFQMSQLFAWGSQSIGVSASTSVLPNNTQDWSPLGWTGWISLQSKVLSRVFSNTTGQKHQFFGAQLSL